MQMELYHENVYFERLREIQQDRDLTGRLAWAALEDEMLARYGARKYGSYQHCRVAKSRWYRRMKNKMPAARRVTLICGE